MANYETKQIRNIALLGHGGSGKTSFAEALLYLSKGTDRLGTTDAGNTVCDFDPEEVKRHMSLSLSVATVFWKDVKINLIDTPGFLGFAGEVSEALRAADSAIIVVDGKAGVEVGTELAWEKATKAGLPKAFFINKFDDPEARFGRVFEQLKDKFGVSICPLFIPMVEDGAVTGFMNLIDNKAYVYDKVGGRTESEVPAQFAETADKYRDMLYEAIAQTSDELMEKYFNGDEITYEEAVEAIHTGIISGDIAPCVCGSATKTWATVSMMDIIAESFPRHTAKQTEKYADGSDAPIEKEGDPKVFIFKTQSDQYGKLSYFKVMSGTLKNDTVLTNHRTGASEKFSHISIINGKKQTPADILHCGDIGVVSKMSASTGDTLSSDGTAEYAGIDFPHPCYTMAVKPLGKGDEDKISAGIKKLLDEDMTLRYENNAETKQQLITGMGDMHLDVALARLKTRSNVGATLTAPKIAYRETIKKSVQAEGKHKKQSGGSGQYGHVKITFSHGENDGLTFTSSVVGGAVPKSYFPAVEKGLTQAMQKGVLAGYPVVNLAADLFDGSYHDVDSNEISFVLAAGLAFKDGMPRANPVLLEPVGRLLVEVPDDLVGDVMGDMPKRRGKVLGMNPTEDRRGYTTVEAEVPQAEMSDYVIALRAMTQGRGQYTFEFVRYEEVPALQAQKIIEEAKQAE